VYGLTSMKYVKLIAKPDTWFKAGTEVYHYDFDWEHRRRMTLEEWDKLDGFYCARGTWVAQKGYGAVENCGFVEGQEYFDGECGTTDEFEVTIVDEPV